MTVTVEKVVDATRWREILGCLPAYDFGHTYDFHRISQINGEGEPVAFSVIDSVTGPRGFWPLLRRPIVGTLDFDFTSVYGYAGPVFAANADPDETAALLISAIEKSGEVTLFSRMHPLCAGHLSKEHIGLKISDIVVIEVGDDEDVGRLYRGGHRREIVKSLDAGIQLEICEDKKIVDEFHDIYAEAMSALRADQFYYFDKTYITSMIESKDFDSIFITARLNGAPVSSSMFIVTGTTMQYYLSGTASGYRKLSPAKAIIAEAHKLAVKRGLQYLVLGGGVGAARDPLFEFKAGFSKLTMPFHVTKRTLNARRYAELRGSAGAPADTDFFPAYRAPAL
jgi:hypothetical protein